VRATYAKPYDSTVRRASGLRAVRYPTSTERHASLFGTFTFELSIALDVHGGSVDPELGRHTIVLLPQVDTLAAQGAYGLPSVLDRGGTDSLRIGRRVHELEVLLGAVERRSELTPRRAFASSKKFTRSVSVQHG